MKRVYDLSSLKWTVEGYTPHIWLFERLYGGMGKDRCIDVPPIPAQVPGSVQNALRTAGIIPDWNYGLNIRQCEWVEHRHWMYRTSIPDEWLSADANIRLECLGLDYSGWIYINQIEVAQFKGTHLPHTFDITHFLKPVNNIIEVIFDIPPRWLGQFGYTSQMIEWKPRFNFTWDWAPRLVQVGIWDSINVVIVKEGEFTDISCSCDADIPTQSGILEFSGTIAGEGSFTVQACLKIGETILFKEELSAHELYLGKRWQKLSVKLWWPNLEGEQPLYKFTLDLFDSSGNLCDLYEKSVGFKHIDWLPCEGAPEGADPWLCAVNGRPVFLKGVNFAPLAANFADLTRSDYEQRLKLYQSMGLNTFRINACQFLEKEWFYDLCDTLGLMVWQEFPLTSSGLENWPPEDKDSIEEMAEIATSFVKRRKHHVSLLLWSGGNELQGDMEDHKSGIGKPCGLDHPMLARLQKVVDELDPIHRYIPTSPSGPRAGAEAREFGKGLHWDVHGGAALMSMTEAEKYLEDDDALFRSELYCSGASPVELIQKYAGNIDFFPPTAENAYWSHPTTWWIDWHKVTNEHGREPTDLAEYVDWSQEHQARMLSLEIKAYKERFPRCGGALLWSGHDTFPMPINSSLIDFEGNLKPAGKAISLIWHTAAGNIN